MVLGKRNHFTIYNALPFRQQVNSDDSQVNVALPRLNAAEQQVNSDDSQVNVAEPRLKDTQSQGDDSPATALRLTSSPAAINRSEAAFTLGVVSRLEHIKGMDLVVPAFAEVRKRFPDVQLLVVGDGSLRAAMEQQAMALGCDDAVTWAGRQPQEELSQYYSRMDVVLMPSRSEGFGLTAIEAMAHGCVVVASDIGGLPEVVRDGVCGLLHRSEDVKDMAEKICSLIASSELYRSLQKNALQHVQKFSFQRYASAVCDLYERLIAT
ncbi:MAG: glycosyltransferase family 4 protein [Bacteroidaceae bacterium]|nr:glycosyltransferase family 4 protein [Bacteroidaceae bacterium]